MRFLSVLGNRIIDGSSPFVTARGSLAWSRKKAHIRRSISLISIGTNWRKCKCKTHSVRIRYMNINLLLGHTHRTIYAIVCLIVVVFFKWRYMQRSHGLVQLHIHTRGHSTLSRLVYLISWWISSTLSHCSQRSISFILLRCIFVLHTHTAEALFYLCPVQGMNEEGEMMAESSISVRKIKGARITIFTWLHFRFNIAFMLD